MRAATSRASLYRQEADRLRQHAERAIDADMRGQFLKLAQDYDILAALVERDEARSERGRDHSRR